MRIVQRQFLRAKTVVRSPIGDDHDTWFEGFAPYGAWSPAVFDTCQKLGLRPVDWSIDPRDWLRPGIDHIVSTVMKQTHTGSIILDHDADGDRSQTVAALHQYLPQLLAAGYRFVQP